jgi:large subunit ribosomal protein L4
MKSILYNQEGKDIGKVDLPDEVFNAEINFDLLHQAVRYYEALQRRPIAKTKTRAEARGGGRKPWRQKGTGRARHGSIRSPIWRGGGVTFGPTPQKSYQMKLPKKMRKKALFGVLSQKREDGKIIFLDKIKIEEAKTRKIKNLLKKLSKIKKDIEEKKTVFVLSQRNEELLRMVKNIPELSIVVVDSLNPYLLLKNKYIVIEQEAIKKL